MTWIPLHNHTHSSLCDAISRPKDIAQRCQELGYTACAMTDHGNANGAIAFSKAMRDKGIKPILGIEAYIKLAEGQYSHQVILAKNLTGWKNLIKLISRSNDSDRFYSKPRIHIEDLEGATDLISFSGHPGSTLSDLLKQDRTLAIQYAEKMRDIFGKDNFFIEIQNLIPSEKSKEVISNLRDIAGITGLKCIATADSHYVRREDSRDQQLMLCSLLQTTLRNAKKSGQFNLFFEQDCFHIPAEEEVYGTQEEKENTALIASICEEYSLSSPPKLPRFINGDENAYLRELCRNGWKEKCNGWGQEYTDRINYELKVIEEANLAGYFLIVQDYVNWAKNQGWLVGPGRGSGGGSLVSLLTGIISIDPVKYGLFFERFYNVGRNSPGKISLPDIDVDFPINKREYVIEYIRQKYGSANVCQIATYGRMQGRGALKEVFRVHDVCSVERANEITKYIPNEADIADQLEESGETSIIRWTLENEPQILSDYCRLNDDNTLSGEYANYFEQAIRLEGIYRTQGKHAAGVVVTSEPIGNLAPMIRDKSGDKICGFAKKDAEEAGLPKMDILGVAAFDKLMMFRNLLKTGKMYE